MCLFPISRGLQPLYRISDLDKRDTEGQEAANGNPLPGHSCGACWRGKKGNHLSWDCSWTVCPKGPGYLKWFLPFEMQAFWECYEHWIKDPFCKEKRDISHTALVTPWNLLGSYPSVLYWGVDPEGLNSLHFVCLGPFRNKMENAALYHVKTIFHFS